MTKEWEYDLRAYEKDSEGNLVIRGVAHWTVDVNPATQKARSVLHDIGGWYNYLGNYYYRLSLNPNISWGY